MDNTSAWTHPSYSHIHNLTSAYTFTSYCRKMDSASAWTHTSDQHPHDLTNAYPIYLIAVEKWTSLPLKLKHHIHTFKI